MKAISLCLATTAAVFGFAACSLDLDEGLIGSQSDAGGDASAGSGGSAASGGSGGAAGSGATGGGGANGGAAGTSGASGNGGSAGTPDAGLCEEATECASQADECLLAACIGGECLYEVCPPIGCSGRFCGASGKCEMSATTYGFQAQQFSIGDAIGCGGNAGFCIAAFENLLFVGTNAQGLKAWDMTDPTTPRSIQVEQPPFAISRLTSTGSRVVVQGPTSGGKLSLAWYDRPASPKTETLDVKAAGVNFASAISATYPGADRSVFLVLNNASEFYPAARVTPPLTSSDTVTLLSSSTAAGARVIGSSGTRLVTFRTETGTGSFEPYFSFVRSAGTPQAQSDPEVNLHGATGEVATSSGAHQFASGHDGSLLWSTNILIRDIDNTALATGVTLRWPLIDADSSSFDGAPRVDLEVYPAQPYNTVLAGPVAWLNSTTAIATAANPANTNQTAVRMVKRNGAQLSLDPGRFVLPFSTGQLGVVGGLRFGYVLAESGLLSGATVYVFAPGCN